MDIKIYLIVLLIVQTSINTLAQSWNLELLAGPTISYTPTTVDPNSIYFDELNNLSFTAGIKTLFSVGPDWQISTEVALVSRAIGIKLVDIPFSNGRISKYTKYATINSPSLDIGTTYSLALNNKSFYVTGAVGIIYNSDNLNFGQLNFRLNQIVYQNQLVYSHEKEWGSYLKIETGSRFNMKNKSYILIGLRYVHGFNVLEKYGSDFYLLLNQQYNFETYNKGSYSGFILGYGINLNKT